MKTGPLLVVTSVSKTPVAALTVCRRITVQEDPSVAGWPTVAFVVCAPLATDSPKQKDTGAEHAFEKPPRAFFVPGEVAGYIATVSGTSSFSQYED